MLQLVTVHRLLGVRPFPEGATNIERKESERRRDERKCKRDRLALHVSTARLKYDVAAIESVAEG